MINERGYVPPVEEVPRSEEPVTEEVGSWSAEQEKGQLEFEARTAEGFVKLNRLSNAGPEQFKSEFYKTIMELDDQNRRKYRVAHPYFLMRELFGRDIAGMCVAEVGACNYGGDELWPSKRAFESAGVNYLGTDIDVDKEARAVNNGQVIETAQVDALAPGERIKGRSFELVYSQGFLGHPTNEIAEMKQTSVSRVENDFLSAWSGHIRPGGFFVAGSRNEIISIDPKVLEELGFDYFFINPNLMQNNDFLIARKRGIEQFQSRD